MDWLIWLLFESLLALAIVLFIIDFCLLVYWRRRGRARPLLIGLTLSVVLLIVQALVVTRTEQAQRVLAGIEDDILHAHTEHLAAALAPDFTAGRMDAREFVAFVQRQYDHVRVRALNANQWQIRDDGPGRFVASVAYQGDIVLNEYAGMIRTRWDITFIRTDAGWRILAIEPTYIDGLEPPYWTHFDRG